MAPFATDTFTETSDVAVTAHTADLGGAWTLHGSYGTGVFTVSSSVDRIYSGSANAVLCYLAVTPPSATYSVQYDMVQRASITTGFSPGPAGRIVTGANTFYHARFNFNGLTNGSGIWEIRKVVAGAVTVIASLAVGSGTVAASSTHVMRLELDTAAQRLYIDNVLACSSTDSDAALTAAGMVGAWGLTSLSGYLDNLSAVELGTAVPVNTVAPVVTGTRVVGQTLTSTTGTWTNSPSSYSYSWLRNGVSIGAANQATYVLQAADAGTSVACAVTATNVGGPGVAVSSNSIAVVAEFVGTDIKLYKAATGGLGGAPGAEVTVPTDVFDAVQNTEAVIGDVEYRAVYIKNTHAVRSATVTVVWISAQTSSPTTDLAIGLAPEAINSNVTTITDEGTAPASVTFTAPSVVGTGLSIGTLAPGEFKGLWLRWTVNAGTVAVGSDACQLAHNESFS